MVTNDIRYIGVDDKTLDLFESQYVVPNGVSYNSYVILDNKVAVMDTVDRRKTTEFLTNLRQALAGRQPDYLVVQHMEPDHAASIQALVEQYPDVQLVASAKALQMLSLYFPGLDLSRAAAVKEGDTLSLGRHELTFISAPMVHWPEVMMTYDKCDKVLFSADGFGKFGALDTDEAWDDEARRYYFNIVGKYGPQVQSVLKKAAGLDIRAICPLHGPVLKEDLGHYLDKYNIWSSYGVESEGVFIACASIHGHTAAAMEKLSEILKAKGCPKVVVHDLARTDMSLAVADAFRYGKLVLATTTYNADIYPFMREFIDHLTERNFQNRTVAFIENGSWAPMAYKIMKEKLSGCKNLTFANAVVHLKSAMNATNKDEIAALSEELCQNYQALSSETANKNDMTALFKIGYGLYVVTSNDGRKDNGLIVNTVAQVTSQPNRIAVTINKMNYSHHVIQQTGIMNLNILSEEAPFSVFENFGFQSGRTADKFAGEELTRTDNGLVMLRKYVNAVMSLKVIQYIDLGTHGMFICDVTEARVISNAPSMTYAFYHAHVKPQPQTEGKKGFVCKICGYVYEGETLPDDFVCPLCKHGAADFEPIQ